VLPKLTEWQGLVSAKRHSHEFQLVMRRWTAGAMIVVLGLTVRAPAFCSEEAMHIGWKAESREGVVAAGQAESVAAGLSILRSGGNAADAAVATVLALSVTDYGLFAIGAEVPILVYNVKNRTVKVLAGMGGAPLDPDAIRWYCKHGIPSSGMKAAAVPAAVSACFAALKLYGTASFRSAAAPALDLLDRGSQDWHPRLAATLRRLIETETNTPGTREQKLQAARDRFYKGDIADELEAWYIEQGGFLRKRDLEAHETRIEDPVRVDYRGYTVCKCGPWTQGPYLCQTLKILETFDLKSMGPFSADSIHTCVEALKLGLADRDAYYGDPLFVRVPLKELLSEPYAKLRASLIEPHRASKEIRPGDPVGMRPLRGRGEYQPWPGGTTTCCVADRWGNVVAATPSGNPPYVKPPGGTAGVAHATRVSSLNTTKGHPNRIEPGKRPRITLTPTLVLKEDKPVLAISVAGGDLQDQVTLSLLVNAIEFGMRPEAAVRATRFCTGHHEDSFNPAANRTKALKSLGGLQVGSGLAAKVVEELKARGHDVKVAKGPLGRPVMIWIDPATGRMQAAGDPDAGRHAGAVEQ